MKRLGAPLTLSTAEAVAQSDLATGRLKRVLEGCAEGYNTGAEIAIDGASSA